MFIKEFVVTFVSNSAQIKLPRPKLVLDPRASSPNNIRFDCYYHDDGITVTLTQIHGGTYYGGFPLHMRVYDPANETVPDFNSTIYTYSGRYGECVPNDTTLGIIHPSVKTIKRMAFNGCKKMKKCIISDGVETIEVLGFSGCISLEALFLPPSIKKIEEWAFDGCSNIRILPLPVNIDISRIGRGIIRDSDTFFQITQIPKYKYDNYGVTTNKDQVHQVIIDLYRNLPPLHRACLDVNVSIQTIHDCIATHGTQATSITDHDGMTPLHILTMNPHASLDCIEEYFNTNISAAFVEDGRGNTPLDYLKEHNLDGHTWVETFLRMHRLSLSSTV